MIKISTSILSSKDRIESTELLFKGDEAVRRALPYRRAESGVLLMPGVLSRKKQLLPEVLAALA